MGQFITDGGAPKVEEVEGGEEEMNGVVGRSDGLKRNGVGDKGKVKSKRSGGRT